MTRKKGECLASGCCECFRGPYALSLGQLSVDVEGKDGGDEGQRQDQDDNRVTNYPLE